MTVYEIQQDHYGYIWMGTANGLCRYDGIHFRKYEPKQLKDSEILDLQIDAKNRIWFSNLSSELSYLDKGEFFPFYQEAIFSGKLIYDFHVGKDLLWVLCVAPKTQENFFYTFKINEDQKPVFYKEFFKSKQLINCQLIGQGDHTHIVYIDRDKSFNNKLTSYEFNFDRDAISVKAHVVFFDLKIKTHSKGHSNLCLFNNRIVCIPSQEELMELKVVSISGDSAIISIMDSPINTTNLKIIDDHIWILSTDGITRLQSNIQNQFSLKEGKLLNNIITNDAIKDREGNHWISTSGNGIIVIPSFEVQVIDSDKTEILRSETFCLYHDRDNQQIISGHKNGQIVFHDQNGVSYLKNLNIKGRVTGIHKNASKKYLLLTDRGNLMMNDAMQITRLPIEGSSKCILEDYQNNLWIGSSNKTVFLKKEEFNEYKKIITKRTYALEQTTDSTIWIGTIKGIHYYQNDSLYSFNDTNYTNDYYIIDFEKSEGNLLWVGTKANGVQLIKDQKVVMVLDQSKGLSSNVIRKLKWDKQQLWIATNNGINLYNPKTKTVSLINKKDGLPSNEVNDLLITEDKVWCATAKGIVQFPRNMDHTNQVRPPIYLHSIKVKGQALPIQDTFLLEHDQNNITIEFVGLGYQAKNAIDYKYKMIGVDSSWIYSSTNIARYPVINPGQYQFEVLAINEDGVESAQPANFSIVIKTPWWQQWGVVPLSFLLFSASFIFFFLQYNQRRERKKRLEEKMLKLQEQALLTQMNPHFIFNSLGSIQKLIVTEDHEKASIYLSQFAKLIRSIFEYSKDKSITLEEEMEFLQLYLKLEQLRFKEKVSISIQIDPLLQDLMSMIRIPPLLFQPLVENSFKHGFFHLKDNGCLNLRLEIENDFLKFVVEDNGIGRKRSQLKKIAFENKEHQSSGISIIRKRIQLFNKKSHLKDYPTIEIEDLNKASHQTGTIVRVYLYCPNLKN